MLNSSTEIIIWSIHLLIDLDISLTCIFYEKYDSIHKYLISVSNKCIAKYHSEYCSVHWCTTHQCTIFFSNFEPEKYCKYRDNDCFLNYSSSICYKKRKSNEIFRIHYTKSLIVWKFCHKKFGCASCLWKFNFLFWLKFTFLFSNLIWFKFKLCLDLNFGLDCILSKVF